MGIQGCLEKRGLWAQVPVTLFGSIHLHVLSPRLLCKVRAGLLSLWQVFSVFGVTLFGAFLPMHFRNMQVTLYTLFICITQDGWADIYSNFQ